MTRLKEECESARTEVSFARRSRPAMAAAPGSAAQRIVTAQAGHRAALAAVVDALRPRLERMARHYARRCGEDADDLLQEAWLGLLDALPGLDPGIGSPEQYLIQRARWRMLDAVRRERVRRCRALDPEQAGAGREPAETALDGASAREFIRGLSAAQIAVVDCLLAGLTWREAGRALGCTSANIAYHVRQIRRRYAAWAAAVPPE